MTQTDWTYDGTWPFEPRYIQTDAGRMHYVDEGPCDAPAVVFAHGNPTWSYLFRDFIGPLAAGGHRVVSVDHLGFGRSDAPDDPLCFTVERHTQRLAALLDSLELRDVTLVPHDWGGPIALPWAARRSEALRGLFLLNTFAPRLPGPMGRRGSLRMLRSRLFGAMLVKRRNVPTEQFLFKTGTAHPDHWTESTKRAYRAPHPDPRSRTPMLVLPREVPFTDAHPVAKSMNSTTALLKIQLADKPVAIVWGMKDVLFGEEVLAQWQQIFPHARVHRLSDAGHFVPEDAPHQVLSRLTEFL